MIVEDSPCFQLQLRRELSQINLQYHTLHTVKTNIAKLFVSFCVYVSVKEKSMTLILILIDLVY
jgi:hypothetical protein